MERMIRFEYFRIISVPSPEVKDRSGKGLADLCSAVSPLARRENRGRKDSALLDGATRTTDPENSEKFSGAIQRQIRPFGNRRRSYSRSLE